MRQQKRGLYQLQTSFFIAFQAKAKQAAGQSQICLCDQLLQRGYVFIR
jgi:hypothetical protein